MPKRKNLSLLSLEIAGLTRNLTLIVIASLKGEAIQ